MLPEVDEAHPSNQLHKTIAYHLNELPKNKSILAKVEKEFPVLCEYVMQVIYTLTLRLSRLLTFFCSFI